MKNSQLIEKIFVAAALYNIVGILSVSHFFSNELLTQLDPMTFSWAGIFSILLWGFAYLSVAKSYQHVPYLLLVFFVEKMFYTGIWLMWIVKHGATLPDIAKESVITAGFYAGYGIGDFLFGLFFLWVAVNVLSEKN